MDTVHLLPEQLAERLHSSYHTLARWRVRGTGPAYIKLGRKVLYAMKDVLAWEEAQIRKNTSQGPQPAPDASRQ